MVFYIKHPRVQLNCGTEVVTKQSHKDECDIHKILNQYKRTGIISHVSRHQAMYADLPDQMDYQQSLQVILDGQEAFATLPSALRDHFHNDPAEFLGALGDPAMREQLTEWGVFDRKAPPPVVPPAPSPEEEI